MSSSPSAGGAELQSWLRQEHREGIAAGLEWGLPRCRTEAERRLYPCLLLLLAPWQAVIAVARRGEDEEIALQVTLSRRVGGSVERRRLRIGDLVPPEAADAVSLEAATAREAPWRTAAEVVCRLLEGLPGDGDAED